VHHHPHDPHPPTVDEPADSAAMSIETTLETLVSAVTADLAGPFAMTDWAEDEIALAMGRHPDQVDALHHAFPLIRPRAIGAGMDCEFVYRSHAAELLERVASGVDTRPATAAELCLFCARASLLAPMHGAAAGLYFRMWQAAFPHRAVTPDDAGRQVAYEKLHGPQIDDLETLLRQKIADPRRRLTGVECSGVHHGRRVGCRYAAPASSANPGRGASEDPGGANATARPRRRRHRRT
jgi:hypothetical protein